MGVFKKPIDELLRPMILYSAPDCCPFVSNLQFAHKNSGTTRHLFFLFFGRKIIFPLEVTIHLAESCYTSRLHHHVEQSPKMTRVLEHYRSFLVQDATPPPDWTSSFPQRGLIVEPPGFSEIGSDAGGDFVSEDVRQWLSAMSSPCSSGQFSLSDSMLDPDSFHSPRKSYTDVLKSSGSSLSVTISMDSDLRFESYKRWVYFITTFLTFELELSIGPTLPFATCF